MKRINISILMNDELRIKGVSIHHNDTDLKNDSKLILAMGYALVRLIQSDKNNAELQDLLNDLGIDLSD